MLLLLLLLLLGSIDEGRLMLRSILAICGMFCRH